MIQVMHGWYSQKMADLFGYAEYYNKDNEVVLITTVSDSSNESHLNWDDVVYVGEVLGFKKAHWRKPYDYIQLRDIKSEEITQWDSCKMK